MMHMLFFKKVLNIIMRYITKHADFWWEVQYPLKGCGMGPWLVLVSPCFRENEVVTCKIGSFFVCVV